MFHQLIRTPPEKRDRDLVDRSVKSAGEISAVLEHFLDGREFVAGDSFTMGDIPIGGVIYRWYAMDIDRPDRPNIRKWYDRLTERPGFAEHIMIPLS